MSKIGKDIIKSLKSFTKQLKSGEDIEATQIRRVETPDGPMYLTEKKKIKRK